MISEKIALLKNNIEIRSNLSDLRAEIKQSNPGELLELDNINLLIELLENEDPKARKNDALLLGEVCSHLPLEQQKDISKKLYESYLNEKTAFVREFYLKAILQLNYENLIDSLKLQKEALSKQNVTEDNKKHFAKEWDALMKLLPDETSAATFLGIPKGQRILLTAPKAFYPQIADFFSDGKITPYGVTMSYVAEDILNKQRCYEKRFVVVRMAKDCPMTMDNIPEALQRSELTSILYNLFAQDGSIYFKMAFGLSEEQKKNALWDSKKTINLISEITSGFGIDLVNSKDHAQVIFHFVKKNEMELRMFLEVCDWKDTRFAYHKHHEATSMPPLKAAQMVSLTKKYFASHSQVIDPMCGVGTLLFEREYQKSVKEKYGLDIYGTAIEGAKENAALAKVDVNWIHRDFFSFTHDYLFDEIICELPRFGGDKKAQKNDFYKSFFEKGVEISADKCIWILLSDEGNLIKQMVRANKLTFLEEIPFSKNSNIYILQG